MLGTKHLGAADGGDENVGLLADPLEVLRARVADRHGAIFLQQQVRLRLADDLGAANDDSVRALHVDVVRLQQLDHTGRGARQRTGLQRHQSPHRAGGESVSVLGKGNALDRSLGVEVARQWHLNDQAMDRGIGRDLIDLGLELGLRRLGGHDDLERVHASLVTGRVLVAHVDLGGRVLADDDDCEPCTNAGLVKELLGALGYLGTNRGGDCFSVDQIVHTGSLTSASARGFSRRCG